jgi:epoxide hydrolase-like predicted phosphatase
LRPYLRILIARNIKNLIFDLGGVILELDFSKTHQAFSSLAGVPSEALKGKIHTAGFFNEYEKGLLTDSEFRNQMRSFLNYPQAQDQEIDLAWNAMILSITRERYDLLNALKTKYKTFLLSNTNNIHLNAVNEVVYKTSGEKSLEPFFHKAYFSHLLKMRKPDPQIFSQVLSENNLIASETLFMDDILENIEGAKSVGIQTIHISSINQILSLFA